ncbi:MAG: RapZ C-terminal domain-containing protein [Bacteroidales bacterium]
MENIRKLIVREFGREAEELIPLKQSGSDRKYVRFRIGNQTGMAAENPNVRENIAFFQMSRHFRDKGINLPEVYAVSEDKTTYLLQDLGDTSLFQHLSDKREGETIHPETLAYYRQALDQLSEMQTRAADGFNYDHTWPVREFDKQAVLWDLNYFKYYYARLSQAPFDEHALEKDFHALADFLLKAPSDFFMFRDFQSRNIMIHDKKVWFIDYQGGRKGALQYDVASLLWQARAQLPIAVRNKLLSSYLKSLEQRIPVKQGDFMMYYEAYVLIRVLQTLGAYGFRGLYEQKSHFILSIPLAMDNLRYIRQNFSCLDEYPELRSLTGKLLDDAYQLWQGSTATSGKLRVQIMSFSYKKGLPRDFSGHGGGHVFDCRALHNPGRYDEFKKLTGKDQAVLDFLDKTEGMQDFMKNVIQIVTQSVDTYRRRKFDFLSVAFGCTGGQHRSVYAAEKMADFLKNNYSVDIVIHHREQKHLNHE